MGKLSRITADEARNLMETSNKMLNWIYKSIREAAEEGRYTLGCWSLDGCSYLTAEKIIKILREDGFAVEQIDREYEDEPATLRISW